MDSQQCNLNLESNKAGNNRKFVTDSMPLSGVPVYVAVQSFETLLPIEIEQIPVADPDLELKGGGGGGGVLIYLPWRPFSHQSFLLFFSQNKGGGPGPPDPSPRSATEFWVT